MDLWIVATLAAAFFQTLRFMLQKHLATAALSATGATFARFVYSAPLVTLGLALWLFATGTTLPALSPAFWAYGALGGLAQIAATVCVVLIFKSRNFAVGITLKKTEVLQTALIGLVLLGESVSRAGLAAILLGFVGVLLLSDPPRDGRSWRDRVFSRAMGLGLASGFLFGISANAYRAASLAVDSDQAILRAAITLSAVTLMQTAAMAAWLRLREGGEIGRVLSAWRVAVWVGLASMAGSLGWFTAFTLQNAAYVNALGQVELIFSLAASTLFFRERVTARELLGIAVLAFSIVTLILIL
ncbi:DMT family transporter [Pseudaestuariivita atlantica]|uniref:Membrane protein n=1 Tax=Pseudaestuariivita atlantica TaxID=1317121 RepID=A0A0L1JUH5_9RHOB|nr:DMT family transporter [Pseudaestuariivita atlantica]KNG95347.1 membrane protein [Pseudaestuariivita atlantica]